MKKLTEIFRRDDNAVVDGREFNDEYLAMGVGAMVPVDFLRVFGTGFLPRDIYARELPEQDDYRLC